MLSKDLSGASTRYRIGQYIEGLAKAGWHTKIMVAGKGGSSWPSILSEAKKSDAVIVQRKTFGWIPTKALRSAAQKLIFDFDDAIFVASNGKPSWTRYRRFKQMVSHCDQIWAGNNYLAEEASKYCKAVTVIPTSIDIDKYQTTSHVKEPGAPIDLVWVGSSSTRKYLDQLVPVLETIDFKSLNLRLKIISDFNLTGVGFPNLTVPWSEETEIAELMNSGIGIAPMEDNPWTRGKCGLKILQYMAAGLPVISSNSGVHSRIVQQDLTGVLVNSNEEWRSAIADLAKDPVLRKQFGHRGQQRITEEGFSLEHTTRKITELLSHLN